METFKVTYKGQKAEVVKNDKGQFHVILPIRTGIDGSEFHETISRDSHGLVFSSTKKDDSGEFLKVWLHGDKSMSYANSGTNGMVHLDEKFNRRANNGGFANDICKDIYDVVKQIAEYDKLGISTSIVGKLRRAKLDTALKLLGYSSIDRVKNPLNDSAGYMALSRIGKQLEEYRNLAAYVYSIGKVDGVETFGFRLPKDMSREEFQGLLRPVALEVSEDFKFIGAQDEDNERRRDLLPDFGLNMKGKVSPEDWEIYSKVVRQTAELYLELNSDIVPYASRTGISNSISLVGSDLADRISRLIDSKEFSIGCNIENKFVMQELERLSRVIDEVIGENDAVRQSSIGATLSMMQREALQTRDERRELTQNYAQMQQMYFSRTAKGQKPKKEGMSQSD